MRFMPCTCAVLAALILPAAAHAGLVTVDYTVDAGGNNPGGPEGLGASATFDISGTTLTVLLENTSTGAPDAAEVSDSLVVSLGFNLPGSITIVSGDSAVIGPGSNGLGAWSDRSAGDSVAEEWLWTNDAGGDLMIAFAQVISTSSGQGGGTSTDFNGASPSVDGPFGGIAADPPVLNVPGSQPAVSDSIFFTLTLSETLSSTDLQNVAFGSLVEFGSDYQYMAVPAPGALALLPLVLATSRRRRPVALA